MRRLKGLQEASKARIFAVEPSLFHMSGCQALDAEPLVTQSASRYCSLVPQKQVPTALTVQHNLLHVLASFDAGRVKKGTCIVPSLVVLRQEALVAQGILTKSTARMD